MKYLALVILFISSVAFAKFDGHSGVRVNWDHVPEIDPNNPIKYQVHVRLDGGVVWEHAETQTNTIDLQFSDIGVNSSTKSMCFAITASRDGIVSKRSGFGCVGDLPLTAPGGAVIELLP